MDNKFNANTYITALFNVMPTFLAFTLPIFFLPLTLEFFEFNKLTLLVVATIAMLLAWAAKMLLNKEVSVVKSSLDMPLMALVGIYLLASIFSINKVSSIFGSQGRWFPSLFGMATMVTFYYAIVSNIKDTKVAGNSLLAFIAGTSVSTIVSLLSYFDISLGSATYLQIPNFTLTGSVTTTAAIAGLASILAIGLLVHTDKMPIKVLLIQAAIINLFGALLLGNVAAYAVLVFGVLSLLYFVPVRRFVSNKTMLSVVLGAAAVTVMMLITPTTREIIVKTDYPKEIVLSPRESWVVSSSIMRDFPLLGTGPSTFYLNYPRYKSLAQNSTDFWNLRFDKPYNALLEILGGLGIIGIIVVAYFVVRVTKISVKNLDRNDDDGVRTSLTIATLSILVLYIFTYATVLNTFLLFLFLALNVALLQRKPGSLVESIVLSLSSFSQSMSLVGGNSIIGRKETFQYIAAIPLFALVAGAGFFTYKNFAGEYFMRQAVLAAAKNDGTSTYRYQTRAITVNSQRDAYHNALARTNIALANSIAAKQELTDPDRQSIQQLIAQAIRSVRVTTEVINPLNVVNWETRAAVYSALAGVAENADTWSKGAYNTSIQLDPANPRLRLLLGGQHFAEGDHLTAANLYRQSIQLKNDYANAHYNLAQALIQLGAYDQAQRELEITARLVPAGSPDAQRTAQDLEALRDIPAVAGTQDGLPTIEELEGATNDAVTEQEPLSDPVDTVSDIIETPETVTLDEEGTVEEVVETPVEETNNN